MAARLDGGSEDNLAPAFSALKELRGNVRHSSAAAPTSPTCCRPARFGPRVDEVPADTALAVWQAAPAGSRGWHAEAKAALVPDLRRRLDPAHTAIELIDVQNDFCHPDGAAARNGDALTRVVATGPRLRALLATAREAGAMVVHVDARTGPLRQYGGTRHGLRRHHRRTGGEVGQRIVPAGRHQLALPPRHDGGGLGMQRDAQAVAGDDLEPFQHGAGAGRGQVAEGVAHEALERGHPARGQRVQMLEVVLRQQAIQAVIHPRLARRLPASAAAPSGVPVGGFTFGISNTVVTPPIAAAAVPVSQSSLWV